MKEEIREFVSTRRFAVVGVSRDGKKFGNTIYRELKSRGYEVYGVNPSIVEVDGDKCFASVTELSGKADAAIICTNPDKVESILRKMSEAGMHQVWLQQGAETTHAVRTAMDLGMNVVAGKCILMYAEPVDSFHAFHRYFVRLFGKY
jgi:uncharacterized protein